ncbi:hypothetical protein B5P19_03005 [Clavibacter sepedonicus]|uniref:Uncharacterized protein n=2 Tax=Microbacteriaceae TaxID=85023 RepID=B0RBD5_CLASE|nr:hypothetical protein B5P19_03005 [Clavibacter sepedonicus]OQJ52917.1 hypothetical protein B5P20_01265 [Clavibacter sepedonicus]CAQ01676.1 hypothetical protein CMS1565 [Clavibacter sepedonicus]
MFQVVQARPHDADRLWALLEEDHRERATVTGDPDEAASHDVDPVDDALAARPGDPADGTLPLLESRRGRVVALVSDPARPVLIAYSGIRAVGFALMDRNGVGGRAFTSAGWRGLGVEEEIRAAASLLLR